MRMSPEDRKHYTTDATCLVPRLNQLYEGFELLSLVVSPMARMLGQSCPMLHEGQL